MKISAFFVAIAMTILTTASCGVIGQTASTATTAAVSGSTNGQQAGAALKTLYGQYKADGKLDMTNLNNIVNLATLAKNIEGLKGQSDKTAFYKDFAPGLILGSNNLVTNTTSNVVTNALAGLAGNVNLSDLTTKATNATSKGTEMIQNASEIASSVSNILNLFK